MSANGENGRRGLYYEELEPGDTFYLGRRELSAGDLSNYRSIAPRLGIETRDRNYVNGDRRTVDGLLVLVASHGLRHTGGTPHRRPGGGFYGIDDVEWHGEVAVGDTIECETELVDKEVYDDERGKMTYERRVLDEDGEVVMTCRPIFLAERRPER